MRGLRAFASSWALSTSTGAEEGGQGCRGFSVLMAGFRASGKPMEYRVRKRHLTARMTVEPRLGVGSQNFAQSAAFRSSDGLAYEQQGLPFRPT